MVMDVLPLSYLNKNLIGWSIRLAHANPGAVLVLRQGGGEVSSHSIITVSLTCRGGKEASDFILDSISSLARTVG